MTTKEQVEQALSGVLVPGAGRSVIQLNMIREIEIVDNLVKITVAATALSPGSQDWVRTKTKAVVEALPEVNKVEVEFIDLKPTELNQIGILDADLTGPSIPKMFGITTRPGGSDTGILPVLSRSGIEVMSINLLLPEESEAVIWRGPLISKAITQFWEDVVWGKLDYLVVDLPPGTADAPLTVLQTLPISGVIIVFTPQDLTAMVVRKAVNMVKKMNKAILGVVENMSYLYVPEIDKRIELFGGSRGEEMAQVASAPFLGQLPIDPELARLCDEGTIESYNSDTFTALSQAFVQALPKAK